MFVLQNDKDISDIVVLYRKDYQSDIFNLNMLYDMKMKGSRSSQISHTMPILPDDRYSVGSRSLFSNMHKGLYLLMYHMSRINDFTESISV